MSLRSGNTRPAPKLVVWNIEKGVLSGYDGKELSQQVDMECNKDTDWEGFDEAIESFRVDSVAGSVERRANALNIYRLQFGYADDEFRSWFP